MSDKSSMLPERAAKRRRKGSLIPEGLEGAHGISSTDCQGSLDEQLTGNVPYCSNLYASGCRCRKDSPHCLAGLLCSNGSYRKTGLWAKDNKRLVHLIMGDGTDVSQQSDYGDFKREDLSAPVGFPNQGSTCYLNGAIQCLFMISSLRRIIYATEMVDDAVLSELRVVFGRMQASNYRIVGLEALSNLLGLNAQVQQDSQEFFDLLVSLISHNLASSVSMESSRMLDSLVQGSHAYQTICKGCGKASESSSNATAFYSLLVVVKNFSSLEQSLESMQQAEQMSGDNQYQCAHCNNLCDATRAVRIKRLPPYLCLSLMRMIHDGQGGREKVKDLMSFPASLDMRRLVNSEGEEGFWEHAEMNYELYGILFHKGSTPHAGHFVAHVKGAHSRWWRCDDEQVEELEGGPAKCLKDLVGTGEQRTKDKARAEGEEGRISSSNAYMLFYRVCKPGSDSSDQEEVEMPERLQRRIEDENQKFTALCKLQEERMASGLAKLAARKEAVKQCLTNAPLGQDVEEYRWVSWSGLKSWANSVAPAMPALDNSDIMCPHGQLHPQRLADARKVRKAAIDIIHEESASQGSQIVEICRVCREADEEAKKEAEMYQAKRADLVERILDPKAAIPASGFYISRPWFMTYKRGKQALPKTSPTDAIACLHGNLLPDLQKSKRLAVSQDDWSFICKDWRQKRSSVLSAAEQVQSSPGKPAAAKDKQEKIHQAKSDTSMAVIGPTNTGENCTLAESLQQTKEMLRGLQQQGIEAGVQKHPHDQNDRSGEASSALPSKVATLGTGPRLDIEPLRLGSPAHTDFTKHGFRQTSLDKDLELAIQLSLESAEMEQGPPERPASVREGSDKAERDVIAFPIHGSVDCTFCGAIVRTGIQGQQDLKAKKERLKSLCPKLVQGMSPILEEGQHYCLLPQSWVISFKSYLKQPISSDGPTLMLPSLAASLDTLLCNCHRNHKAMLHTAVKPAVKTRGKWTCEGLKLYVVVDYHEALQLLQQLCPEQDEIEPYWPRAPHPRMIRVRLLPEASKPATANAGGDDRTADEDGATDNGSAQDIGVTDRLGQEAKLNALISDPEVCPNAQPDNVSVPEMYGGKDAVISMELVEDESGLKGKPGTRPRSRRRSLLTTMPITAGSLLADAKQTFAQAHGLVAQKLRMYIYQENCWKMLSTTDEAVTLRELGIEPGAELRLIMSQDMPGMTLPPPPPKSAPIEDGFAGTLLHGTNA